MQNIVHHVKRAASVLVVVVLSGFAAYTASAQKIEFAKEKKAVVKHYRFVGDQMTQRSPAI